MVEFTCGKCRAKLRVAEDQAGHKGKCPKCGWVLTVPVLPHAPQPPASIYDELAQTGAGEGKESAMLSVPLTAQEQDADALSTATIRREMSLPPTDMPTYWGVQFIGKVYAVFGYIAIAIGAVAIAVLVALLLMLIAGKYDHIPGDRLDFLIILIAGVWWLFLGAILVGIGQLFYCVRDIAQNSYWLRRL